MKSRLLGQVLAGLCVEYLPYGPGNMPVQGQVPEECESERLPSGPTVRVAPLRCGE